MALSWLPLIACLLLVVYICLVTIPRTLRRNQRWHEDQVARGDKALALLIEIRDRLPPPPHP